jgi:hypothetical protein
VPDGNGGAGLLEGVTAVLGGLGGTILLLMPGYILGKTFARGVRGPTATDPAFLSATVIGGVVTHLIALGWTVWLADHLITSFGANDGLQALDFVHIGIWAAVVLIVLPAVLGALVAKLSSLSGPPWFVRLLRWLGLSLALRTAEAWVHAFRTFDQLGVGVWVRIRLKSGSIIIGAFGPRSLASSDPTLRDIYLEKSWPVDDRGVPLANAPANRGVWVAGDQIAWIEFF